MENVTNVRIVKDPFFRRLIRHPFKYYGRTAGFTFCLVSVSNFTTTLMGIGDNDGKKRKLLTDFPQVYFMGLLAKSSYFGLLWPSFYFTAIKNPDEAFVLGAGIEKVMDS